MGVVGTKKALGLGLRILPIRLQKALSCIDRSCWIQKLHALKNTGFCMKFYPASAVVVREQETHWLTDGGSAEGLCLARADYF